MQLAHEPIVIPVAGLRFQSFSRRRHIDLRRTTTLTTPVRP